MFLSEHITHTNILRKRKIRFYYVSAHVEPKLDLKRNIFLGHALAKKNHNRKNFVIERYTNS